MNVELFSLRMNFLKPLASFKNIFLCCLALKICLFADYRSRIFKHGRKVGKKFFAPFPRKRHYFKAK